MRVEHLYRYPVKGLSAEALEAADLAEGGALPWDRAFALAQGDSGFDPAAPRWLPKHNFMCLMKNARIARLASAWDETHGLLRIASPDGDGIEDRPLTEAGRARIAAWLARFLDDEARGTPSFHHLPGFVFGDQRRPVVSLINLASLAAYEAAIGATRERLRFRANVYFTAGRPWMEFDWIGETLRIGGAVLRVTKRTERCPATQVNPATAERDADPQRELHGLYGHRDLGVHAVVVEGGRVAAGSAIELAD